MSAHFVSVLLTASVLTRLLQIFYRPLALYLPTILMRIVATLSKFVLVRRYLLNISRFNTTACIRGLRLLLLNYCVDLILQPLVLLKDLIVAFNLLLVGVYILNDIDFAAIKLRDMDICLTITCRTKHVL